MHIELLFIIMESPSTVWGIRGEAGETRRGRKRKGRGKGGREIKAKFGKLFLKVVRERGWDGPIKDSFVNQSNGRRRIIFNRQNEPAE